MAVKEYTCVRQVELYFTIKAEDLKSALAMLPTTAMTISNAARPPDTKSRPTNTNTNTSTSMHRVKMAIPTAGTPTTQNHTRTDAQ